MTADDVKSIRISDPHAISVVRSEQNRRGDSTPTKTAARMLAEYAAILEMRRPSPADRVARETVGA